MNGIDKHLEKPAPSSARAVVQFNSKRTRSRQLAITLESQNNIDGSNVTYVKNEFEFEFANENKMSTAMKLVVNWHIDDYAVVCLYKDGSVEARVRMNFENQCLAKINLFLTLDVYATAAKFLISIYTNNEYALNADIQATSFSLQKSTLHLHANNSSTFHSKLFALAHNDELVENTASSDHLKVAVSDSKAYTKLLYNYIDIGGNALNKYK